MENVEEVQVPPDGNFLFPHHPYKLQDPISIFGGPVLNPNSRKFSLPFFGHVPTSRNRSSGPKYYGDLCKERKQVRVLQPAEFV